MSKKMNDPELEAYKECLGEEEFHRQYCKLYGFARSSKYRHSKITYVKVDINKVKEKYKNGVTMDIINEMLDIKG